jgi:hypothetical protein
MMAKPGLYPVDAVGFGFTSIHRRALANWPADGPAMFGGENELGHDMWFCRELKRQTNPLTDEGCTVHVDTGLHCGHLTETTIIYDPDAAKACPEPVTLWPDVPDDEGCEPITDLHRELAVTNHEQPQLV